MGYVISSSVDDFSVSYGVSASAGKPEKAEMKALNRAGKEARGLSPAIHLFGLEPVYDAAPAAR
jgi:pyrimidine deaminase RibD-like protein